MRVSVFDVLLLLLRTQQQQQQQQPSLLIVEANKSTADPFFPVFLHETAYNSLYAPITFFLWGGRSIKMCVSLKRPKLIKSKGHLFII